MCLHCACLESLVKYMSDKKLRILPPPFFLMGDLLSVSVTTAISGLAVYFLIPSGWFMVPAMILAMLLSMFIALILVPLVLGRHFGAMEVMVPCMLGSMFAGMWVSMMQPDFRDALHGSLAIGLVVLFFCYLLNLFAQLRGIR